MVRQLAKASGGLSKKKTTKGVLNVLRGKHHFHFCSNRDCRLIYEDACGAPEKNERCQICRGTTRNNVAPRDPQECCINNCEQVIELEEQERYKLAGSGPWYQCRACKRVHGWSCVV